MKKILFFLMLLPVFCFAQTNTTPQFKRNIPADSLLGFSIPGVTGNHWLPDTAWVKKHAGGIAGSGIPLNFLDTVKVHENGHPLILFQTGPSAEIDINSHDLTDGRATFKFHTEKGTPYTWELGSNTGGSSPTIGFSLRDITRDSTGIFNVFSISPGDDVFTHNTGLILKNLPSAMTGDSSLVIRNDTLFRVPIGSGGSFLPLTFVADNTVNLHNNALNIVDTASNNIVAHFGGANVSLTVLSALDFSGNSSDLELNRGLITLAVASGGGTNVKQIVLDTLNKGIEVLNTYGHGISYNSTADYSNGLADSLSLPPLYIVRGLIAAAGGGITALTGDGTAAGPGSAAFTLATVNSNTGSFGDATHVATVTLNGKGLATAASSTAITFPVTASNTVTFTNKGGNISQWTNDSGYALTSHLGDSTIYKANGSTTGNRTLDALNHQFNLKGETGSVSWAIQASTGISSPSVVINAQNTSTGAGAGQTISLSGFNASYTNSSAQSFQINIGSSGNGITDNINGIGLGNAADYSTAIRLHPNILATTKTVVLLADSVKGTITTATGANPTATAGVAAVNGSAPTFMRSDAAPKVDSSVFATHTWAFAAFPTKSFAASTYQPLEDQRLSTTNSPSFVKESLLGTAGAGYLDMLPQSVSPAAVTGHLRLYSDSVNRPSWKNSIYRRTIQVPYPSDYTIRMPYKVTGTTLEDSTHAATTYQTILSSGTTLKTVNSISLLGSGNVAVTTGNTDTTATGFMPKANTKTLAQLQTAFNLKANIASPTFTGTVTIPNGGVFGTPTSMTATNVTGLPLTTAVTGILPVANGGSGVGTITGLIKGNGTSNYSAATAGTDYNIPIVFTTTGTSGAATYNSGTGALNIPNYAVFTNPLTTLGDLPYGGASGTLTKLAGNTTVARAFLSETESGGTAAAPAFFDLFGTVNTFSAAQTFSGAVTLNSLITTGTNNNFVQFSNVGAVATGNAQYQFAGSSNVTFRSAFGGGTTSSSVSNSNVYANSLTAQSVFSVATGVTIPWAVQQEVASFGTITLTGSGAVTNTAMLRVENAATAGTNNYSIWLGTGLYHYDGLTASQAVYTDVNKNLISKDPNTSLITGTPTIVAGTGAGTGPTVTVTTNGKQLQVTVTTGTLPTGTNATIATVTLPNALTYTPLPVFSSASAATALLSGASMIFMTSTGTANVTITSGTTALTAATTYVWNITL